MVNETAQEVRCPGRPGRKCGSTAYYFRNKTDEYVCKKCGAVWKLEAEASK